MSFVVRPCFPADAPGLAATMMRARLTDPHWAVLWEDPSEEDIVTNAIERVPWNLVAGTDIKRHQKAVDLETGQVVGYARWRLPPCLAKKNDVWLEAQVAEGTSTERAVYREKYQASTKDGRIMGMKDEMLDYRSAPLEAVDARIMRDGPFLTLDYLVTDPAFWRRGIASMLVKSGLQVAAQYGIKTYVMSEPAGLNLYLNLGFKLVETVSTDYSQYGGTEPTVEYFLIREASL